MTLAAATQAATAAGLALGFDLDQLLCDPRHGHPVAGFGRVATLLEQHTYADRRGAGVLHLTLLVGATAALGGVLASATRRRPALRLVVTAAVTWSVLGGRSLQREAQAIASQLGDGDLAAARRQIRNLVGRDPAGLSAAELARACVESVAENTSDAVVAPLFWGAAAGLPGLLGYRAANTLDAMVGHRSPRYARFGTAAARLDDALNFAPSRLTAALTIAAAPTVHGDRAEALRVWRRDRGDHPSPNAGQCESSMAGALGVRLGGRNVYFGRTEVRPLLGDGPRPTAGHIKRAAKLSGAVGVLAVGLAAVGALTRAGISAARLPARWRAARLPARRRA